MADPPAPRRSGAITVCRSASALWNANIRSLAGEMDLLTAARFEAIGFASVMNSLIAVWDAKFTYMFWRPVTAIQAGDTDGNRKTEGDAAWTPLITTPRTSEATSLACSMRNSPHIRGGSREIEHFR